MTCASSMIHSTCLVYIHAVITHYFRCIMKVGGISHHCFFFFFFLLLILHFHNRVRVPQLTHPTLYVLYGGFHASDVRVACLQSHWHLHCMKKCPKHTRYSIIESNQIKSNQVYLATHIIYSMYISFKVM